MLYFAQIGWFKKCQQISVNWFLLSMCHLAKIKTQFQNGHQKNKKTTIQGI